MPYSLGRCCFRGGWLASLHVWQHFHANPSDSLANHIELFGSFLAKIELHLPIMNSAISNSDEDGLCVFQVRHSHERAEWEAIMRGREFIADGATAGERIGGDVIPGGPRFAAGDGSRADGAISGARIMLSTGTLSALGRAMRSDQERDADDGNERAQRRPPLATRRRLDQACVVSAWAPSRITEYTFRARACGVKGFCKRSKDSSIT